MIRVVVADDIGVIHNYLIDEAARLGINIPRSSVLRNLEGVINAGNGVVAEIEDTLVGFALWEHGRVNYLTSFYIAETYRTNKHVLLGLYSKVVEEFAGKKVMYKPLHSGINGLRYCTNGYIDIEKAKEDINRLVSNGR